MHGRNVVLLLVIALQLSFIRPETKSRLQESAAINVTSNENIITQNLHRFQENLKLNVTHVDLSNQNRSESTEAKRKSERSQSNNIKQEKLLNDIYEDIRKLNSSIRHSNLTKNDLLNGTQVRQLGHIYKNVRTLLNSTSSRQSRMFLHALGLLAGIELGYSLGENDDSGSEENFITVPNSLGLLNNMYNLAFSYNQGSNHHNHHGHNHHGHDSYNPPGLPYPPYGYISPPPQYIIPPPPGYLGPLPPWYLGPQVPFNGPFNNVPNGVFTNVPASQFTNFGDPVQGTTATTGTGFQILASPPGSTTKRGDPTATGRPLSKPDVSTVTQVVENDVITEESNPPLSITKSGTGQPVRRRKPKPRPLNHQRYFVTLSTPNPKNRTRELDNEKIEKAQTTRNSLDNINGVPIAQLRPPVIDSNNVEEETSSEENYFDYFYNDYDDDDSDSEESVDLKRVPTLEPPVLHEEKMEDPDQEYNVYVYDEEEDEGDDEVFPR